VVAWSALTVVSHHTCQRPVFENMYLTFFFSDFATFLYVFWSDVSKSQQKFSLQSGSPLTSIWQHLKLWAQLTKTVHTARLGLEFVFLCFFLGCMVCLYVGVCFVLPWTVDSFPFMFWRWRNKLKWAPFELFAPSSSLRFGSWLHPFKGHCEQKSMRDKGVIYVACHPLLNRRCTRLPGCFYFPKCKL